MRFVLFFIYVIFLAALHAQERQYSFKHLNTADGLSQSSATAIHQDHLGQIWIGTRDGLNKYDGAKFTIYRNNEADAKSISNNDILSLQEDDNGLLWVGTYNGLNVYNPKTDSFKRYLHNEAQNSLLNNTIWSITKLSNGEIWIGTTGGLSIYNPKTDAFTNYLTTYKKPKRKQVMSVLETKTGQIYVGTGAGVFKKIYKEGAPAAFQLINGTEKFFVQDLEESAHGTLLMATQGLGLIKYHPQEKTFKAFFNKNTAVASIKNVRQLLYNSGILWVGTYEGLVVVEENGAIKHLSENHNNLNGLSKNSIKYLFKDKKGSIWIGTYYGGINIWDTSNINFQNITRNQPGYGLNYSVVSSIAAYKETMIFGTEGGGLNFWNKNDNTFKYKTTSNSPLVDNNIKHLKLLNEHQLAIGTFKNGFQIYNLQNHKFITPNLPEVLQQTLSSVGVYAIEQDNNNNLWIGTFGQGLFKYNLKTRNYQQFTDNQESNHALSNNLIRTICIDTNNSIWVGTEKGLNRISESGNITKYFYDESVQYGDDILSVYQDANNSIWVATKARGLFKFNGQDFKKVPLNSDGVTVSAIRSIQESDEYLWISTNQGIIKYNTITNAVKRFNQSDGIISNEFNDNASLKVGSTQFFFGGPTGVTYINTKRLTTNNYAPKVILTNFNVRESKDEATTAAPILKSTLPYTKTINLSHTQGNFSISFAIPSFINPSNNKYKYRLQGLEKEWNYTTSNTASYTIQNPGDYTFEVSGANNDNVWNETITKVNICVAPAPWRTWWAFTIYALLILGALYFLFKILKSRTKLRHELQLEHVETERTKEINKTKLEFFTNISHEFRTPLALILGPLNQVIEDYRGSSKIYKKLLVIQNNANHLLQLINRLMDFRKFENKLFNLEAAEGNILKFLREIYLSFTEHAKNGGYNFEFICDEDEILIYYDRNKLERVFYNLISNAFRYTPKGGHIVLRVTKKDTSIDISVEDSGVGVAEEYRDKIFERFFEVAVNNKPDNDYNKGSGIGLSIVKNIVELHKGTITLKNNAGNHGSIFTVTLQLGSDHLQETEILQDYKFSDDLSLYVNQLEDTNLAADDELELEDDTTEKPRILLVEDNKPLRKFMKSVLKQHYTIIEAENGKLAFTKAKKELPELIVSDVIMPEMTGTALCAAVKGDLKTSHIPIILLTSRTSLIYKIDGLEKGADDYINKPFNVDEFKLRIKNLLHTRDKLKQKFASNEGLRPDELLVSSYDEKLYQNALKIVKENIGNEQFDIAMFCSELGVSRTMLFTKIKAWSNFTPNDFILHFRMKRAAQYLEQGKLNISQICYKVGFKNPKYFSKSFQKKYGVTPSQYAQKFTV